MVAMHDGLCMYHRSQISSLPFERRLASEGGRNWSFGEIFVLSVCISGTLCRVHLSPDHVSFPPDHLKLQILWHQWRTTLEARVRKSLRRRWSARRSR
jgi:hypothetical protein